MVDYKQYALLGSNVGKGMDPDQPRIVLRLVWVLLVNSHTLWKIHLFLWRIGKALGDMARFAKGDIPTMSARLVQLLSAAWS